MKFSFKQIVVVAVAIGLTYGVLTFLHNKEIDGKNTALRLERESHSQVVEAYNEQIGVYTTRLGELTTNLTKEKRLTDEQRNRIKALEKDLGVKIDEVNTLTIAFDAISDSGQAAVIIAEGDSMTYNIDDYKNGVRLTMALKHPSGAYNYSILHDPLAMEIYGSKEKDSGIRIGSIKFPTADYMKIESWQLFYDEDTRPWYSMLWDDIHLDVGAFGGPSAGLSLHIGYKRVGVGPVFTEQGMNVGIVYRLK